MLKEMTNKVPKTWGKTRLFARRVIILISGKAGAGKTTTAELLLDKLEKEDYLVRKTAFANIIKHICYTYLGWDGKKDEKGRKLLQGIGNIGRQYDENIWVKNLLNESDDDFIDFIIIDDWRFPNELNYILGTGKYDVFTLRVIGNRENDLGKLNSDISEISLKDNDNYYDSLIYNTSTIDELKNTVNQFVDRSLLNA